MLDRIPEPLQMKILRLYNEGMNIERLTERFKGIVSNSSIRKIVKGVP